MGLISNGTTVFDAGSMASGFGSSMVFIKKLTASGSANLTFHNGTSNVILDGDQLSYSAANDQAQGTGFQRIATDQGTGNDENMGGFLRLFNPASTTFVKHFISNCQSAQATDYSMNRMVGGYINTTAAIDEIQFKAESGNIDAGDICLYGIA